MVPGGLILDLEELLGRPVEVVTAGLEAIRASRTVQDAVLRNLSGNIVPKLTLFETNDMDLKSTSPNPAWGQIHINSI